MLTLEGITRRFGAVTALEDVTCAVRAGTVHALLGENGAGKTTLMRIAFGALAPTAGVLRWKGQPVQLRSPADALALGIGMVHQHFTLVPTMTVAENVALGGHGRFDPLQAAAHVQKVAARAGLTLDPSARVDGLSVGAQQRTEIVKVLARDVQLLILDEPTAVLVPDEAQELLAWVRRFADAGHAVVLITHKLRDALAIADELTVLRRGRVVLTTTPRDTTAEAIATAMIGAGAASAPYDAAVESPRAQVPSGTGPVRFSCRHVHWRDPQGVERIRDVSLDICAGEIVAIAAVEGSGQQALLRLLAGRLAPSSGQLQRPDVVGFIPEDRHREALLLDAPLYENLALRGAGQRRGRMHWSTFRQATDVLLAQADVRASGPDAYARTLSGGNQQKFVLARELEGGAPAGHVALVAENPTRGLDFRATAAVLASLRAARDAGASVVLYSSDLDEVLQLADRVYVLFDGTVNEVPVDRARIGQAMLGDSRAMVSAMASATASVTASMLSVRS